MLRPHHGLQKETEFGVTEIKMVPHYRGGYWFAGLVERARELRKKQTPAEALLWELLRNRRFHGVKFRRQHQFGDYIADFYCHEAQLIIECDGVVHKGNEQRQHDKKRDACLAGHGLRVLRFTNEQILKHTENVLREIAKHLPLSSGVKNTKSCP